VGTCRKLDEIWCENLGTDLFDDETAHAVADEDEGAISVLLLSLSSHVATRRMS
jgi:hypothetical protein